MKKILLGLGVVALLSTNVVQAQNEKGQLAISVGAGQSLLGSAYSGDTYFNTSVLPVINGMVDFAVSDVVSMGLGVSYQSITWDIVDYMFLNANNVYVTETFSETLTKLNIGVRCNFHYARGIDNLDMYSGFRLGYTNWSFTTNTNDPNYIALEFTLPLALQLVPFGMRYYFTDMIGVHLETGIIGPYMIAGGLSFKM